MRRTYRSKKETAGALDPKDAIQAMDEKSSAFDAFYIQNIKQTKRELSCVGSSSHYGTAANKVRKRKYVKRIVKDTESSFGNTESHSVFLTPDKSIRVNKAQDLFDQLLISSPPQLDSPKNSWNSIRRVPNRQEAKTYTKRKLAKINCSSSDSTESDKENSNENCDTQNVTDLRSYELLVEKERKPSPKYLDESINRIVNNISLLNNINCHRNTPIGSAKKLFNNAKHRLTTNFQSPSNSPSCSTPFKEKYRSQSIYKFSPIAFGVNNASPDRTTIAEENANDSVVFVDNKAGSLKRSCCEENPPSPIIHLSTIRNRNSRKKTSSTNPELQFMPAHNSRTEEKEKESSKNKSNSNDVEISSIEISDLQTTESEPFLGFTNEPFKFEVVDCIENENGIGETDSMENKSDDEIFEDSNSIIENLSGNEDRVMKDATLSEIEEVENESSYDTCNSEQESQLDDIEASKVPIIVIERLNDSVLQKYLHKTFDSDIDHELSNELDSGDYASFEGTDATRNNTANSSSLDSKENILINHKSLVNTSDTDNSILTDSEFSNCNNEEDSVLQKYLHKTLDSDTDHELSNELDSDDYASFEGTDATRNNTANSSSLDRKENILINHKSLVNTSDTDNSILTDSEFSNCNNEEERCVSFVTTRRRNEITNDSLMYSLNNSCERYSCTDCEKTVLSNNAKVSLSPNIGVKNDADNVNSNDENVLTVTVKGIEEDCLEINNSVTEIENNRTSTMRSNSTRIHTANDLDVTNMSRRSIIDEGKPGIVLQPGKKWERSLSIYRRFTMMSDSCDKSMLDDEDVTSKGRKYRQSVINTIELQDKGSLHNESIISRRSTFVSKPCRSTIRIIKEPNTSRLSLGTTAVSEDLRGFLNEDCDDTIIELSKLSIADSEHEVTVIENFHDTSNRVSTARDYVLRRCSQSDAILFDECYPEAVLKNCRKIGEGVYGEVFLWRAGDGRARVMKIVPIAGTTKVNGERQKDFQEIISEIVIAMELSALRAPIDEIQREFDEGKSADSLDLHSVENATDIFNEVLAVRCVYGAYPSRLLDLWELYDECNGSENDNPAILPVDQQYIVLELANAGRDLESYEFNSAEQAHALFLQVAFGLAVGEEAYQFEHRDLHWGNVLIAPTDQKFATFVVRGRSHRVARCGVAATIIDYSLSRLSLPLAAGAGDAAALYNDLAADDGLFDAVGDYQFQVYRLMRDKLGNDWKNFEPYTNILWLHYTVDKMITALRYKRTNTKIHKHYIAKLKGIKNRLLEYGSAAQFVLTDNEF